jgi:Xaa-Pro aminopeptidase
VVSSEPHELAWPSASPASAFSERRARLRKAFSGAALLPAGFARPRNFAHNAYPFRAHSQFLYFVGRQLEGAALLVEPDAETLYVEPVDPSDALWNGPKPGPAELERELGLPVKSLDELDGDLSRRNGVAAVPPPDVETALWLSETLGRVIEPDSALELEGADLELSRVLIALRLCHDGAALSQLREAARVTAIAHQFGMQSTRAGTREASVASSMVGEIQRRGMTLAYQPIVTTHGEVLHDVRHDRELRSGDLLLVDVGAEGPEGWASDVTRTWPVSGRFSSSQRELYEVVLAAQHAAIARVAPGVRYLDVHRAAGRAIVSGLVALGVLRGDVDELYARGAAALFFPHGIGHLLGLDVHDMEDLGDLAGYAEGRKRAENAGDRYLRLDRDLAPGMLVTIEPGYYRIPALLDDPSEVGDLESHIDRRRLAAFDDVRGIRIEDDVLVTESGAEVLTQAAPKAPDELEAVMRGG